MKLYAHQERFIRTAPDKWGVWHACGTGKTITGMYQCVQKAQTILVICPKGVKSKWREEGLNRIPNTVTWCVVSKEEFRRDWDKLPSFTALIIDEAHHFSSIRSQLYKNLMKYIRKHKVRYVYPMTATPYRREPLNIFALATIMGHEISYPTFMRTYYDEAYFPHRVWVPKKNIEKQIAALVCSIGDVVSFSECGDLPAIEHKLEHFDLTASQKRALGLLELTEANPLTYYLREHQICAGIGAQTSKMERLDELAECNDKLAIFCRYTAQIDDIQLYLEKCGYPIYIIDGRTKNKAKTAEEVEIAEKAVVIIQSECAEGFELPSVHVIVFASMGYSYLAYEQSLGRFIRINVKNKPKLFIHMLTKDSIDEAVHENIMAKQDFSLEIYAKQH